MRNSGVWIGRVGRIYGEFEGDAYERMGFGHWEWDVDYIWVLNENRTVFRF